MNILNLIRKSLTSRSVVAGDDWEPVVRPATYVPLQMRKRGEDGTWVYRTPTEAETVEYIQNEAW
jgi:hypothetical protein